jgi:hypothetical protein
MFYRTMTVTLTTWQTVTEDKRLTTHWVELDLLQPKAKPLSHKVAVPT